MDVTQQVLRIKEEATYNTAPTFAATDAILVENFQFSRDNLKMVARSPIEASKGTRQKIYAASLYSVTFDMEIKGSGSAGVAPECGVPFRGAGMGQVIVATTSVTYSPVSSSLESVAMERYIDGKLYVFTGCRGNWELKVNVHDKLMASYTFIGHLTAVSDTALGSAAYDTTIPSPVVAAGFVVDGYSAVIASLSVGSNSEIKIPPNMNAADGFGEITLGKRNVSGAFDPEDVLIATYDFRTKFESNALAALSVGAVGGTAGSIFNLSIPAISYVGDNEGSREDKVTRDMQYEAHQTTGDNDVAIAFT